MARGAESQVLRLDLVFDLPVGERPKAVGTTGLTLETAVKCLTEAQLGRAESPLAYASTI